MRNIIKDLWENSPDSVGILAPTISKLWSCEHLNVIYTLDVGRSISFLTFLHHQSRRTFSIFRFLQRMVVTSAAARIATLESVHYPNDREERRKKKTTRHSWVEDLTALLILFVLHHHLICTLYVCWCCLTPK